MKTLRSFPCFCAGLLASILLGACTKETNNYYAAPAELTGSALGFVALSDEFGRMARRHDGTVITVKDTNPLIQATSDTNGRYQLDGLRAGNYLLTYSKPGYGAYEQEFMLAAAGGNQPVLVTQTGPYGPVTRQLLYQQSTTTVTSLTATVAPDPNSWSGDSIITLHGTFTPASTPTRPRAVAITFDTVGYVSNNQFYTGVIVQPAAQAPGEFTLVVDRYVLDNFRPFFFRAGQRHYARAYGCPAAGVSGFLDRRTGLYLYSSMNPQASSRVSFQPPQ